MPNGQGMMAFAVGQCLGTVKATPMDEIEEVLRTWAPDQTNTTTLAGDDFRPPSRYRGDEAL